MNNNLKQLFDRNGYVVIEELLNSEECDEMRETAYALACDLVRNTPQPVPLCSWANDQHRYQYFVQSNDKILPFSEISALNGAGHYATNPVHHLNKIGHAVHWHPLFRCYTYCDRVKSICRILGLQQPVVIQSMIIFKNPGASCEDDPHQDSTFLHSAPIPVVGFWFALEDVSVENGCLWIASGSHKSGLHRRLKKQQNVFSNFELVYDGPSLKYSASYFIPVPVKKGSCILLHGHVVHTSGTNITDITSPAYAFHVLETKDNVYSLQNWLQEGPMAPFSNMYQVQQVPTDMSPDFETRQNENRPGMSGEANP